MINKEYINVAIDMKGNFAADFFNNLEKYKDSIKPSDIFSNLNFENIKTKNALDSYILKYYSKLNVNNPVEASIKKNMDKYLVAFFKDFLDHPTEHLDSPFLTNLKDFCPEVIMRNKKDKSGIVQVEFIKEVEKKYIENLKEPEKLYIRHRNTGSLSNEETNRLMHYFISNIDTANKQIQIQQKEYIKKLILENKNPKDMNRKEIEFIAKYVNNYMLNSRLAQLGYNKDAIKNQIYVGEEKPNLGGFENKNFIFINKNSILTKTLQDLIHTVCHETEHSIQELEAKNKQNSKIGLDLAISNVFRNYYNSRGYDVYHSNYRFEQIEQDAEKNGYYYAAYFLDELGFQEKSKEIIKAKNEESDNRRFEYDYRIDENGGKSTREKFLFENLNKVVAQNKKLINEYPSLVLLYTDEGEVRPFEEIISCDFKVNEESKSNMLDDFCKYYISRGKLKDIDLNKFPKEMQVNIASRLINVLGEEKLQLEKMGNGNKEKQKYKEIDIVDKQHIEMFHLKNSKNIMQFVNNNYQYLKQLQEEGKFSSIINMDSYDNYAEAFKKQEFYEYLTYNNQDNIEKLRQLSLNAEQSKKQYRQSKKGFNKSDIENSFISLAENSKMADFQKTTSNIKMSMQEIEYLQEVEEK